MELISSEQLAWVPYPGQRAPTTRYKEIFKGRPGAMDNFELSIVRIGEGGSFSPRHRHNFEQFRLPLNGAFSQSPTQEIPQGHIGYVPEGTSYGPQELTPGLEFVILQCGGPSGCGYMGHVELMQGTKELQNRGEFAQGVFRRPDKGGQVGRINQDAYEAVWEHVNGKPIEYARPRYKEPVTIDPEAFPWQAIEGAPGVKQRHLGTFNETGSGAFQVQLEDRAAYVCKADRGRKLLVVLEGAVLHRGRQFEAFSGFNLSPGESMRLGGSAAQPAVMLALQLPHFKT